MRVIDQIGDYKILKASNGYVVKNVCGKYENHGHFKKLETCYTIIKIMKKKQVPKSNYLRGSVLRLSLDEKYIDKVKRKIQKDKSKQAFVNVNKGIKK